jgi:hypothetical protein
MGLTIKKPDDLIPIGDKVIRLFLLLLFHTIRDSISHIVTVLQIPTFITN